MATLLDAVLQLGRKLQILRSGTADSGSTTTCVDGSRFENDDTWNKGTFINITNSEWSRISDFAGDTGTFTFDAITAVDADDRYAALLPKYPLDILVESINTALQELEYPREDTTSLDTVDSQTIYTLPAGITEQNLFQVWVQQDNDSATDDMWKELRNWEIRPQAIGSQHKLVINSEIDGGYDLRLVYTSYHPYLDDPTDVISENIPLARILPGAAYNAVSGMMNFQSSTKREQEIATRLYHESVLARAEHFIPKPRMGGKAIAKW